jgi:glycerophosphoryl diester phosphodiesterase
MLLISRFRAALSEGADALELDLRLTSDGHLIAAHSPHSATCTDDK